MIHLERETFKMTKTLKFEITIDQETEQLFEKSKGIFGFSEIGEMFNHALNEGLNDIENEVHRQELVKEWNNMKK